MIFTPHIILGAAIGAKTHNLGLIIILGLLSHFIMDKIPHWDYSWSGIKTFKKTNDFKTLFFDFLKIATDCIFGLLIVFLVSWYRNFLNFNYLPFILFGIFISILPDITIGLSWLSTGRATRHIKLLEKYHYPKDKEKEGKITFLGLTTEILVIIISIITLFFF
ncbi:MAG: hypothetical protein ACOZAL_00505 [Patescibacteria group bacterium]